MASKKKVVFDVDEHARGGPGLVGYLQTRAKYKRSLEELARSGDEGWSRTNLASLYRVEFGRWPRDDASPKSLIGRLLKKRFPPKGAKLKGRRPALDIDEHQRTGPGLQGILRTRKQYRQDLIDAEDIYPGFLEDFYVVEFQRDPNLSKIRLGPRLDISRKAQKELNSRLYKTQLRQMLLADLVKKRFGPP